MQKVEVIVVGNTGSGKSTIVALIEKALEGVGFGVHIVDNNNIETTDKRFIRANNSHAISAITDKTEVTIEELTTPRQGFVAAK